MAFQHEIAQDFTDSSMANVLALAMFDLCSEAPYPDYIKFCETNPYLAQPLLNANPHTGDLVAWNSNSNDDNMKFQYHYHYFDVTGYKINIEGSLQDEQNRPGNSANLIPGLYIFVKTNKSTGEIVQTGKFVIVH